MGCCLFASVMAGAPRVAFMLWWLFQPVRITNTFDTFVIPLLGVIFLPWLTLVYVIVAPGGIQWFDWIWLAFALLGDLGSYTGGGVSRKRRYASVQ